MKPQAPLDEGARRAVAANEALRLHAARLAADRRTHNLERPEAGDSPDTDTEE